jgi:16S rRNA G1207 methylase RsmC
MAIASTTENMRNTPSTPNVSFYISDSLNQINFELDNTRPDLILCNPPFHQAHSIGDHIAWQMLKQSHDVLENRGELWIVGNRHLGYHVKMKKLFGNCRTIAGNTKFVVLASVKTQ